MKRAKTQATHDFNFLELLNYLYSHRLIVVLAPIAFSAVVGLITFFIRKPIYLSQSIITVELETSNQFGMNKIESMFAESDVKNKLTILQHFLSSVQFRTALLAKVDQSPDTQMLEPENAQHKRHKVLKAYLNRTRAMSDDDRSSALMRMVSSKIEEKKGFMILEGKAPSPILAWAVTDLVKETLLDQNLERNLEKIRLIKTFLIKQELETKVRLDEFEKQLSKLRSKAGILGPDEVANRIDMVRFDTRAKLSQAEGEYEAYSQMHEDLVREADTLKANMANPSGPSYFYIVQLQKKLELLNYQQALILQKRSIASQVDRVDMSPEIKDTSEELRSALKATPNLTTKAPWEYLEILERQIKEVDQKRDASDKERLVMRRKVAENDRELKSVPEVLRRMGELLRTIKQETLIYTDIQQRLQDARLKEAGKANDLKVVSDPEFAESPVGLSVKMKYLMGAVLGLIFSLFVLFIRYLLLPPIRNRQDLENFDLTVLGEVPWIRHQNFTANLGSVIIRDLPDDRMATPIRQLTFSIITHLAKLAKDAKAHKTMAFLSAHSGEGKSFTAANVAYSLALSGRTVLVIDMDLDKCDIERLLTPKDKTVTKVDLTLGQFPIHLTHVTPNLTLLAPESTAQIRDQLEVFWEKVVVPLSKDYDIVIVDTPNLDVYVEPLIISQLSDVVVFVAHQRWTLLDEFRRSYEKVDTIVRGQKFAVINFSYDEVGSLKNYQRTG